MMILTSLRHAKGHLSAADIFEEVKAAYPYVDISTVYRTLTVLKDMRLISETHMGGGDATFEWVASERHHHLICRQCDGVTLLAHKYLEKLGCGDRADDRGSARTWTTSRSSGCARAARAGRRRRREGARRTHSAAI